MASPEAGRGPLGELARLFFRLGATAFGGPAAHIAMMEDEVVRRRRWLERDELLDLIGATNLIPGPNSTELAIHIGYRRAGWKGLIVAGVAFIVPAMLITGVLAWLYVRYGTLPEAGAVLHGVAPVIIAVVVQALWGLAPRAARRPELIAIGVGAVVALALGVHELAVLGGAGLLAMLGRWRPRGAAAVAAPVGLGKLFLFFAKVGSVLFGSGYVLLAFLRADLVERWHWLSERQLLDAVAAGQVTPGPVFTTATFIGYVVAGFAGAAVATAGIFLPAFGFVAASGPLVPRLRRSAVAGAFLDGVNVASLALMAVVTFELGRAALVDVWTVALAATAAVVLVRFRVNSMWLVLGGAVAGAAHYLLIGG